MRFSAFLLGFCIFCQGIHAEIPQEKWTQLASSLRSELQNAKDAGDLIDQIETWIVPSSISEAVFNIRNQLISDIIFKFRNKLSLDQLARLRGMLYDATSLQIAVEQIEQEKMIERQHSCGNEIQDLFPPTWPWIY